MPRAKVFAEMRFREIFVIGSAVMALAAIVSILGATAYLRGGHPPASGIVAAVIFLATTPFTLVGSVIGLASSGERADELAKGGKFLFIGTGVCVAFTTFAGVLFFLKVVLGRPV
jgi:hypothetical protein